MRRMLSPAFKTNADAIAARRELLRRHGFNSKPVEPYDDAMINTVIADHFSDIKYMTTRKFKAVWDVRVEAAGLDFVKRYGEDVHVEFGLMRHGRDECVSLNHNLDDIYKEKGGRIHGVVLTSFDGLYFTTHSIQRLCERWRDGEKRFGIYHRYLKEVAVDSCCYGIEVGTCCDRVVVRSEQGALFLERYGEISVAATYYSPAMPIPGWKKVAVLDQVEMVNGIGLMPSLVRLGI